MLKATTGGFIGNDAATTVIPNSAFDGGAVLASGSQSYALVYSADPIVTGADWDTGVVYDGTLNSVQAGAVVLDVVGFFDSNIPNSGSVDRAYGPILYGYSNSSSTNLDSPDALTRFVTDSTPYGATSAYQDPATSWYGGNLMDVNGSATDSSTGIGYSQVNNSGNRPLGAAITPAGTNWPNVTANAGHLFLATTGITVTEGGVGTIRVVRYGGLSGSVSVDYTVVGGTAQPADYTGASGTVTFADGQDAATITVNIVDDATPETSETIIIGLSNPTAGAIAEVGRTTVTISQSDSSMPTGLLINEISQNPPQGALPEPYEFVELRGTPNTVLLDVYLMFFEGTNGTGTFQAGILDGIIDLSGAVIGSNGLLLIRRAGGFTPDDPATGIFESTYIGSIESDNNSAMLFYNTPGSALPVAATDYDTGAGTSGTLPPDLLFAAPGLTTLDSIAWKTDATAGVVYGNAVVDALSGATTVDAVVRLSTNNTPSSSSAWFYGNTITGDPNNSKAFDLTKVSANFPAGYQLTPGGANIASPPPAIVGTPVRNFLTALNVQVTFTKDVSASLSASDFVLTNTTTSTVIPSASLSVTGGANTATITYTGAAAGLLPNGAYELQILPAGITDTVGNPLGAGLTFNFNFLNGDTQQDGKVNFSDLLVLAANYNQSGAGIDYSKGDFNYDGTVNFNDLLVLAANYNQVLASVVSAAFAAPVTVSASDKKENESIFNDGMSIL
ncbi:MAG: Calx-beta domain-containing protein [Tepidisphaeraceae bacterium]